MNPKRLPMIADEPEVWARVADHVRAYASALLHDWRTAAR